MSNSYHLLHVSVMLALLTLLTLTHLRGPTGFSTSTSDVSERDAAAASASSTAVTRLHLPLDSSTTSRWTWRGNPPDARDTALALRYHRDLHLSSGAWRPPQHLRRPAEESVTP